jgi:hypothetical protein
MPLEVPELTPSWPLLDAAPVSPASVSDAAGVLGPVAFSVSPV